MIPQEKEEVTMKRKIAAGVLGFATLFALSLGSAVQARRVQAAADPPQMMCCRNPGNPDMACCKNPGMQCCRRHPNALHNH